MRPARSSSECRRSAVASPADEVGCAIEPAAFAARLEAIGGFERRPHLAVAVSGGPDSLALALLAADWAAGQGGRVSALVVDHGLRPESASEATAAVDRLRVRGIEAALLRWDGPYPTANLQAAARSARYRLLEDWCRSRGVLHLLIGHHRDDQIETLLQRLDRGSGVDGLAGIAPVAYRDFGRLLRPLLDFAKVDLIATCAKAGVAWAEDPGNHTTRFARSRLRGVLARSLATPPRRLVAATVHTARARIALERATADALAQCLRLDPTGVAFLRLKPLRAQPEEIVLRAISVVSATVAGAVHPPRLDRLERLVARLLAGDQAAGTFGGCRWTPLRATSDGEVWMAAREPAAIGPDVIVGAEAVWDGRFLLTGGWEGASATAFDAARQAEAKAQGWVAPRAHRLPRAAWASLPALYDLDGLVAVPHLHYCRSMEEAGKVAKVAVVFHPRQPFANASGHGSAAMAFAAARKSFR